MADVVAELVDRPTVPERIHAISHEARITLRCRGGGGGGRGRELLEVDQVINCTGPAADPSQHPSRLVQNLLGSGWLTPDLTGRSVAVDAQSRLIDRDGHVRPGVHYLGPWLRSRDWEITAVPELRRAASAPTEHLVADAPSRPTRRHSTRSA